MISGFSVIAEGPGRYIQWGVIQISVANLAIITVMVLLFILALVVPFPTGHDQQGEKEEQEARSR